MFSLISSASSLPAIDEARNEVRIVIVKHIKSNRRYYLNGVQAAMIGVPVAEAVRIG